MMVPVVFVTWTLSVLFATLAVHVALRLLIRRGPGTRLAAFPASAPGLTKIGKEDEELVRQQIGGLRSGGSGGDIEIAAVFARNGHRL